MFSRTRLLIFAVFLIASLSRAQEEQSANSTASASARYWTAPRVQQEPSRGDTPNAPATAMNAAQSVRIDNELLAVIVQSDGKRLTITDKASGRAFFSGGDFKSNPGTAKVVAV
jgi:hypothetical protein